MPELTCEVNAFDFIKKTTAIELYKKLVNLKLDEYKNETYTDKKNVLENEIYELITTMLEI